MKFQASNKPKLLQISSVYPTLTSVGLFMSNPNRTFSHPICRWYRLPNSRFQKADMFPFAVNIADCRMDGLFVILHWGSRCKPAASRFIGTRYPPLHLAWIMASQTSVLDQCQSQKVESSYHSTHFDRDAIEREAKERLRLTPK